MQQFTLDTTYIFIFVLILITWPPDECTLLFCSIIEKIVVGGLHLLLDDVQKIINKRDRAYFLFKKNFFPQRIFNRSCCLQFRTLEILIRVQVLCYLTLLSTYIFFQSWIFRVTNLTYHYLRKSNNYEPGLQPQISSLNQ